MHPLQHQAFEQALLQAAEKGMVAAGEDILDAWPEGLHAINKHHLNYTALHTAALAGKGKFCKMLLQRGADPNALAFGNQTALDVAIRHEHTAAVKAIIPFVDVNQRVGNSQPPLWVALHFGNRAIVEALAKAGADPMGPCAHSDSILDSVDRYDEDSEKQRRWLKSALQLHADYRANRLQASTPKATARSIPRVRL